MATATKKIVPPAPVKEVVESVTLVLSPAEAQVLADMFEFVGGPPEKSRRALILSITKALTAVGVRGTYPINDVDRSGAVGPAIYFTGTVSKNEDLDFTKKYIAAMTPPSYPYNQLKF